eukprot:1149568-Pyramimonas_sp.AAC.1
MSPSGVIIYRISPRSSAPAGGAVPITVVNSAAVAKPTTTRACQPPPTRHCTSMRSPIAQAAAAAIGSDQHAHEDSCEQHGPERDAHAAEHLHSDREGTRL